MVLFVCLCVLSLFLKQDAVRTFRENDSSAFSKCVCYFYPGRLGRYAQGSVPPQGSFPTSDQCVFGRDPGWGIEFYYILMLVTVSGMDSVLRTVPGKH